MKTFTVMNKKGGVGKTTTAINLAYILATSLKKRVLLIDADSQGNASSICSNPIGGLASLLWGLEPHYEDLIDHTDIEGLDMLTASEELDDLDLDRSMPVGYRGIRDLIAALEEDDAYDVCVIDCPPHYSVACLNAIAAADRVIIPADTTAYSAEGMESLVRQIESVRNAVAPHLSVSGVLVTGVRRSDLDEDAVSLMRENAPVPVFKTTIRRSDEPVRASSWARRPACDWSPWCNASRDYRAWVAELVEKEGL